jgi:hypothetical protein
MPVEILKENPYAGFELPTSVTSNLFAFSSKNQVAIAA